MNEKLREIANRHLTIRYDEDSKMEEFSNDAVIVLEELLKDVINECAEICLKENVSSISIDDFNSGKFTIQDLATRSCGENLSNIIKKRFGVAQ